MRTKINLTIPTPCHENWDKMLPADKGKFCQSCSKEVIDFSAMSDSQLVAFFKKPSTASVCGRFMDDQLEREIVEPRKRLPWIKYFFQFALPAFLISSKVYSQGKVRAEAMSVCTTTLTGDTVVNRTSQISSMPIDTDSRQSQIQGSLIRAILPAKKGKVAIKKKSTDAIVFSEIKGRIVDEAGEGIPYASVLIKGTKNGIAADSSGYFTLKPVSEAEAITIDISSVGYKDKEEVMNINENSVQKFVLHRSNLEEVVVVATAYSRTLGGLRYGVVTTTVWDDIKDSLSNIKSSLTFSSPKFSIYPNPVATNSSITIQTRKLPEDFYQIQIFNLSGQLMLTQQERFTGDQNIRLRIPGYLAGTYFVRLTGKNSRKAYTEKLIIQ